MNHSKKDREFIGSRSSKLKKRRGVKDSSASVDPVIRNERRYNRNQYHDDDLLVSTTVPSDHHPSGRWNASTSKNNPSLTPLFPPPTKNNSSSDKRPTIDEIIISDSKKSNASIQNPSSILSFMDSMNPANFSSGSIQRIIGVDFQLHEYEASFSIFRNNDLERAFSSRPDPPLEFQGRATITNYLRREIHHPLLGKIQDRSCSNNTHSNSYFSDDAIITPLAFPRCRKRKDHSATYFGNYYLDKDTFAKSVANEKKRRFDGLSIPLSVMQFPPNKKGPFVSGSNDDGHDRDVHSDENMTAPKNAKSIPALENAKPTTNPSNSTNTNNNTPQLPNIPYQGKLRIVSDRGATIREIFDIDESQHVIGKLSLGDERYFVEKKVLPAPPIDVMECTSIDSDSEEEEDECVAVVRYKVLLILDAGDCRRDDVHLAETDGEGHYFGWISDGGRLADDSYLILKEV